MRVLIAALIGAGFIWAIATPSLGEEKCPPPTAAPGCERHFPDRMACYWDCAANNKSCARCTDAQKREFEAFAAKVKLLLEQEKRRGKIK